MYWIKNQIISKNQSSKWQVAKFHDEYKNWDVLKGTHKLIIVKEIILFKYRPVFPGSKFLLNVTLRQYNVINKITTAK